MRLSRIGKESPPVLRLSDHLLINVDNDIGRTIAHELLERNDGRWTLIEIVARHSHEHISQVASAVRDGAPSHKETLGLVKRRFIRSLIS